jgi:2-methylcitrate dehydratase PrpD
MVADTVGAIVAGARCPEVIGLAATASAQVGGSAAILTAELPRTNPAYAAFVNAVAAVSLELDEGGDGGHGAAHVVPAALAAAQHVGATGREFLTAVVAGYEVATRLGAAVTWHPSVHGHGHVGSVGAAVAVSLLLGRDQVAAARLASNLPVATMYAACFEGATVRNVWPGISNQFAFMVNDLAQAGFTSSANATAEAFGTVLGRVERVDLLRPSFADQHLMLLRNSFKLHSCCFETHAALEAAIGMGPIAAADVTHIDIELADVQLDQATNGTPLANRFSIPYVVATALVHGHARPDAFATTPDVLDLSRRVVVRACDGTDPVTPGGARVTVTDIHGRHQMAVDRPYGSYPDVVTIGDLRTKFLAGVRSTDREGLFDRLMTLPQLGAVSDLFE